MRLYVPVFQVADVKPVCQISRSVIETTHRLLVLRNRTRIDTEGQGNERIAKHQTLDVNQRQYPFDDARSLSIEVVGAMSEASLDHSLPSGTMKESCTRAFRNKAIPVRDSGFVELPDCKVGRTHLAST